MWRRRWGWRCICRARRRSMERTRKPLPLLAAGARLQPLGIMLLRFAPLESLPLAVLPSHASRRVARRNRWRPTAGRLCARLHRSRAHHTAPEPSRAHDRWWSRRRLAFAGRSLPQSRGHPWRGKRGSPAAGKTSTTPRGGPVLPPSPWPRRAPGRAAARHGCLSAPATSAGPTGPTATPPAPAPLPL